jgi:hypothetical protein
MTILTPKSADFSVFVSDSSKIQKQKTLKRAADKAMREQRKVIAAARQS